MVVLHTTLILLCVCYVFSTELDWWQGGNFYQIYPRSFMDSDGDGLGDLQGIKLKLPYLKDLGMDGVWLSPIYKSPMADHGYDISDFRDIYDKFGTMKDFEELLNECKKLGLKLILDFVPNHSSDKHEWFKKSERREPGYENYYIWHPGKFDNITQRTVPANNWLSNFRFSAWRWSDIRNEMYFHVYHYKQPDLNYRNPNVVEEMKNVLKFWLEKGVSGFRIDAIPNLFEIEQDKNGNYPDEPLSNDPKCNSDDFCYLDHIYTLDQPETYDMVFQWRALLDDFKRTHGGHSRIIMTEAYRPLDITFKYYGDQNQPGSHVPFNFELIKYISPSSTAEDYKRTIESWLNNMPKGQQANWVIGNHDQHRAASRLGVSRGDMLNILVQTLPGIAITYQGEELVLEDTIISWNDTQDPWACNSDPEHYHEISRDPARTPFPWDDTKNAGFSNGDKTWLPVADNYKIKNVKVQEEAENSHLKIFQKLTKLRKSNYAMKSGNYHGYLLNNNSIYAYSRNYSNELVIVALNFGPETEILNLATGVSNLKVPEQMELYVSSLESGLKSGTIIDTRNITLGKDIGIVLRSGSNNIVASFILILIHVILVKLLI